MQVVENAGLAETGVEWSETETGSDLAAGTEASDCSGFGVSNDHEDQGIVGLQELEKADRELLLQWREKVAKGRFAACQWFEELPADDQGRLAAAYQLVAAANRELF